MPCIIKNRRKEVRNFMGCSLRSTLITPRRNYCRSCAAAITIPFKKLWILVKNAATLPKWSSYLVIIHELVLILTFEDIYVLKDSFRLLFFYLNFFFESLSLSLSLSLSIYIYILFFCSHLLLDSVWDLPDSSMSELESAFY